MVPFYGWGSTASRLYSHFEEAVYFLPLSSQKFLVLTGGFELQVSFIWVL